MAIALACLPYGWIAKRDQPDASPR